MKSVIEQYQVTVPLVSKAFPWVAGKWFIDLTEPSGLVRTVAVLTDRADADLLAAALNRRGRKRVAAA